MTQTKSEWRRALVSTRSALPEAIRRAASTEIAAQVRRMPCFAEARTILGYVAFGAEVDVGSLLAMAPGRPTIVRVPVPPFDHGDPRWALHANAEIGAPPLGAGRLDFPAVAVIPGVGFDWHGTRLGRGGGFYDRAIADLRRAGSVVVLGVGFDCQVVPELPCDVWDQRMDVVLSEERVLTPTVPEQVRTGESS